MSQNLYETLKQAATAHAFAYSSPDPWNPEKTLKYRSTDCVHYLHPHESVPDGFNGALDQAQYVKALKTFAPVIDKCTFEIYETIIDVQSKSVAMRLRATFDFKAVGDEEPDEKGYTAEYVYVMNMDESGEKIAKMDEFLDPQRLLGHVLGKAERYNALHGLG